MSTVLQITADVNEGTQFFYTVDEGRLVLDLYIVGSLCMFQQLFPNIYDVLRKKIGIHSAGSFGVFS